VPYLVFALLCLIWGSTWIGIKFSLTGFPPFVGAALRFCVGLVCLLLVRRIRPQALPVPREKMGFLVLSAFLLYPMDYGLVYWAEVHLSAGLTAVFFASFPLFTGLFSHLLYRLEPFRWTTYAGLIIGLSGIVTIFANELGSIHHLWPHGIAALAVLIAAISGAWSLVIVKAHLIEINSITLNIHQLWIGILFLGTFGLLRGEWAQVEMNAMAVGAVVYLGMVATALAFSIYYWLLRRWRVVSASLLVYIVPLVSLWLDHMIFGEKLDPRSWIGLLIVFCGILTAQSHHFARFKRRPQLDGA